MHAVDSCIKPHYGDRRLIPSFGSDRLGDANHALQPHAAPGLRGNDASIGEIGACHRKPHHVTQRGNRRQKLFTQPGDYALYRDLLAERCDRNGVACWAYCLTPNHVHLILTPIASDGLSRAVGEAHRRYTAFVNARARVTGHLFQGRFGCVAMDEAHMLNAVRYLAFNPVRAKLCAAPGEWQWSSVRAHLKGRNDALVEVRPVLAVAPRFGELLAISAAEQAELAAFESLGGNGRPIGDATFLAFAEQKLGRRLRKAKPGPKPKLVG
ncbi:transposase [Methylocapsa sp. S129]|uniref:transposase n=1 Tax=Methylocapsa sp. S129 TaxID=1641869 RepID=UPI001FEE5E3A|nr:transposase [Methylocapsa sp. S129]